MVQGGRWGQTCGPSALDRLANSEVLRTPKPLAFTSQLLAEKLLHKAQGLSLVERETEACGLRGNVIALKSLSSGVLHHSQDK